MPRAPLETWGRTSSGATGSKPPRVRIAFSVRVMSGAVSASVPSRSKSTASITHGPQEIVHVHVASQRIDLGDGIVGHAGEVRDPQPATAAGPRELGGPDEAGVLVRALRKQAEDVLGAHDREEE